MRMHSNTMFCTYSHSLSYPEAVRHETTKLYIERKKTRLTAVHQAPRYETFYISHHFFLPEPGSLQACSLLLFRNGPQNKVTSQTIEHLSPQTSTKPTSIHQDPKEGFSRLMLVQPSQKNSQDLCFYICQYRSRRTS